MSEKPILFSGPMVRAILEGRKTQTRRVVKPDPEILGHRDGWTPERTDHWIRTNPYGVPGDRLWVRETFMWAKGADIRESFIGNETMEPSLGPPPHYWFRATEPDAGGGMFKWRPSIFMPRWASRITLEITDVRVQRVQEISEVDIDAEGVLSTSEWLEFMEHFEACAPPGSSRTTEREYFAKIWDKLNAKRGFSWESNPWVWCISFRRIGQ